MAFDLDDPLVHMSAVEISSRLEKREFSSEDVVRAHLDRIVTLDGKVGAFVAVHRGEALAAARRSDEARARGDAKGRLFGVPVTVKENLDFEGRPATLGIIARRDHRATRHATIVKGLLDAGAIVLGQTNVPQLLLSHETRNPLYGVTVNVWSKQHAPGGSSGGEASAIAAGFTPLGVGTDIGGSIRVPAGWSGITGFKPTLDRWPTRGSNGALAGQETVRSQVGPMARSVDDLMLLLESVDLAALSADDPALVPMPFRRLDDVDLKTLRVGFYVDDGFVAPSRAVGRAVHEASRALEGRVAAVKAFVPPSTREAMALYFGVMSADGGRTAWAQLAGTTVEPTLAQLKRMASLPAAARGALGRVLRGIGQERAAFLIDQVGEKSVEELWRLTRRARAYRYELMRAMAEAEVDVLLCPLHSTPAVPHKKSTEFQIAGSHSMLFNLVQFPAGVVPVTVVREDEAQRGPGGDRFDAVARAVDEASAGLPVGVQIAAPPFRDEAVLAVMRELERALSGASPKTPRAPG
jgi:fatty acid amide hydrolase